MNAPFCAKKIITAPGYDILKTKDTQSVVICGLTAVGGTQGKSASDWLNQISHAARPIRSTTQICIVTHHEYGISALVSQTSFHREISGGVRKCQLFSYAKLHEIRLL